MSGIVSTKKVTKNILVVVKVGLRVQRGDESMIKRAQESNKHRIKAGEIKCNEIAKKAQEELGLLIKEYKLKKNIGKMPNEFDVFPYGSENYSKYPHRVVEQDAKEFTGKECIYGFETEEAQIFIYFEILPEKDIRVAIANKISEAIEKDKSMEESINSLNVDGIVITYISVTVDAVPYNSPENLSIEFNDEKNEVKLNYSGLNVQGQEARNYQITQPLEKKISIADYKKLINNLRNNTKIFDLLKESKLDVEKPAGGSSEYGLNIYWREVNENELNKNELIYSFYSSNPPENILEIIRKISSLTIDHDMIDASQTQYD